MVRMRCLRVPKVIFINEINYLRMSQQIWQENLLNFELFSLSRAPFFRRECLINFFDFGMAGFLASLYRPFFGNF